MQSGSVSPDQLVLSNISRKFMETDRRDGLLAD